jgi:uncharacterized protein
MDCLKGISSVNLARRGSGVNFYFRHFSDEMIRTRVVKRNPKSGRKRLSYLKNLHIAVIGSGISGLSAAWLLSRKHNVTLIDSNHRIGGHSNTVDVRLANGQLVPVDTGFIVSNTWTYPNFTALMAFLGVEMHSTKMTFSVSADQGRFEYSGDSLATLLGPVSQWLSPSRWRLVADLVRFYKTVEKKSHGLPETITLGQFLAAQNYSELFVNRHILPIAGAIWSTGNEAVAQYPLRAFVNFFVNHRLFQLGDRPHWQTVKGGSRTYIRRMMATANVSVVLGQPIAAIKRDQYGVDVHGMDGFHRRFDHVVIATHGDQALRLLEDPHADEVELLSEFKTSLNRTILHRDPSLMPQNKRFWSAWNYSAAPEAQNLVTVTYWMNALQKLQSSEQHFVSLNPLREPNPRLVDQELSYRHPIFTPGAMAAQKQLWTLQGKRRTWFAGAWFGAGFHEDGLQAGLAVAEQLGDVARPWSVANPSGRINVLPVLDVPEPHLAEAAE